MRRRELIAGLAMLLALGGCQSRDPQQALIGRWRITSQADGGGTNWNLTFSGTGGFDGEATQWSTAEGRGNENHRVRGRWTATQSGETVALRLIVQDPPPGLQASPATDLRWSGGDRLTSDDYVMERQPQP